ncbi:MAG: hypothetical protein P8L35_07420 [Acidimicrobiales bacterium]|nr:hypothetical protein [Acidimicrobiales bacterium]
MAKIDVVITSQRENGDWTWRAVGAREPKGTVEASLLPDNLSIGAKFSVETEHFLDGVVVTKVFDQKQSSEKGETLEILGSGKQTDLVTTQLAKSKKGKRSSKRSPSSSNSRADERNKSNKSNKSNKTFGEKDKTSSSTKKKPRNERKNNDSQFPKSKRLKAKKHHRNEAVKNLPDDLKRLGEILLQKGIPGLRDSISTQNETAKKAGEPEIPEDLLLKLAERVYPDLRTAEWLDRADGALRGIETVDLRDIRSVIVASENVQKNDAVRSLAEKLKEGFNKRVDNDQKNWLKEVISTLKEGRVVRALRLSSRPPKAGFPLPEDLLNSLTEATNEALSADVTQSRWGTIAEAAAFSPIHERVIPAGVPKNPNDELLKIIRRISSRAPSIANKFDSSSIKQ